MVIELITGFPGSGKSFSAIKQGTMVADSPLSKKWVMANFPIKPKKKMFHYLRKNKYIEPRWIYKKNEELTVEYLIKTSIENGWDKKESQCLLIFDEAGIPFNARTWNSPDRMQWLEFLPQHRKFGYDILLICQDAGQIDKQIRKLCEYEVVYKRLNNMFVFSWLSLFRISVFAGVKYWNGLNARYTKGQLRLTLYDKKTAARYDTYKKFDMQTTDALKNENDKQIKAS